jgi:tetraacyldisaccharide 4'-kinase
VDARTVERGLERGWLTGPASSLLARPWELLASRRVARPLRLRAGDARRIVTVGGATLGGSYKTPIALATVRLLAATGATVALVGHAYRAHPRRARSVEPTDPVHEVGDEALDCASQLVDVPTARVVVAPTRQDAVDLALAECDLLVIDGALQLHPLRSRVSLLTVDAAQPWGAGACPPCGDLRAPVRALLAECDRVVAVGDGDLHPSLTDLRVPLHRVVPHLHQAQASGGLGGDDVRTMGELSRQKVGLWTSVARPARVLRLLASAGIRPMVVMAGSDHVPPSRRDIEQARAARAHGVEVWLCTTKCQVHVGRELGGSPAYALDLALSLDRDRDSDLVAALTTLGPGHSLTEGASATSGVREAHA